VFGGPLFCPFVDDEFFARLLDCSPPIAKLCPIIPPVRPEEPKKEGTGRGVGLQGARVRREEYVCGSLTLRPTKALQQ
jgi:hypothetical protein